jgi:hypothetical protein
MESTMRWSRIAFLFVLLLCALPRGAAAQASDMLTGRVVGPDGKPVVGARVEAISIETEITRSALTDASGRYMILFPDGGGRYVIRISFLGMAPEVRTVVREGSEELLLTNVTLTPQAIRLDGIEVTALRPPPGQGDTGERSTDLSQDLVSRLPIPDLDPNTLAQLAAGVIATTADSLSGALGFSVAGMSDLLNQIVLDGVVLGGDGMGVPEEGVRRTQVTTSTFDVSRGGFAGGQVSMTTARGNNRSGGSFSYRLDDDALQLKSSPTTNAFTRHNFGGSWGGPIIRNRLFYNTSFQYSQNANHRFALTDADPLAAIRSGVSVDSISRFLSILSDRHGFQTPGGTGRYNQLAQDFRLQGRVDWNLVQSQSHSQTLSARFNMNVNGQDSTRINVLDLADHGGETERNNRLGALSLTSRFGRNWTNALNLSYSRSWNQALPYSELPEGVVRVTSDFEDGTRGTRSLVFGGNRSMPTEAASRDIQLSDELSFLLPLGSQLHRLKVGGSLQRSKEESRSTDNLFGSFTYASLAAFEANLPERYDRALTERQTKTARLNTGVYLGDTWRVSQPLEITLGLRWDRWKLDQRPGYNPAVEAAFGRRTDIEPAAAGWSPRLGFNYRLNQNGQPARSLSGGVGLFSGYAPTSIFSTAMRQTGLPDADQRLLCIGAAVPVPDWERYLLDPSTVPDACADGGPGAPPALSTRAPTVTLIDPSQKLPSSLRVDLGYRTKLPLNLNGDIRYGFSRGIGLWGYRDLNLDETKRFALAGEDRLFFGDPSAIVPETGASSMATSRRFGEFGNVYDVTSSLASETHQVTFVVNGMVSQKTMASVNYTLGFSRDQTTGLHGGNTAGNPNLVEWGTSGNDRRHTLALVLSHAITPEIEISAMSRISSGSPFTPIVNRDVNGDGVRNDRAFIFDPSTATDPAIAEGMNRLLAVVPARIRDCLESQFGTVAERNSCRNGWTETLDVRASLRPKLPRLERRLTLSLDGRNVLTGLDQLVNGKNGMKGWGEGQRADANLLEVRGFDPARNAFRYQVNEGFGQARRGPNAFRSAFSVTLSARVALGGQPMMNNRGFGAVAMGGMGGGRGGFVGGTGGGERMIVRGEGGMGEGGTMVFRGPGGGMNADSMLASALANPVARILALKDSLKLGAEQVVAVKAISDSLDAQLARRRTALAPLTRDLAPMLQGGGERRAMDPQTMQRIQTELQPQLDGARREQGDALRMAERVLTAEQWQKVPEQVRTPAQPTRRVVGGPGGFNAVALVDRMLANPLPVLLELKDTLKLTPEQVSKVEEISNALQEKLNKRREMLGRRFDGAQGGEQGRIFQEVQPEIEAARREITDALKAAQRALSEEQWKQVPERVRDPFRGGVQRGGR